MGNPAVVSSPATTMGITGHNEAEQGHNYFVLCYGIEGGKQVTSQPEDKYSIVYIHTKFTKVSE